MANEPGSGSDHEEIWGPQEPINIIQGQKGIVPKPGLIDRIQQWNLDRNPISRRKVIKATVAAVALSGIGAAVYENKKQNQVSTDTPATPTPEVSASVEITPGRDIVYLDKDNEGKYLLTNVAQYLELESLQTAPNFVEGKPGFEPRLHEINLEKSFDVDEFRDQFRITEATSQMPENICVVRVGIKVNNENPIRRVMTSDEFDHPEDTVYVWLALADRNSPDPNHPVWVDEHGNPITGKIVVFSPIYGNTGPLKKKE